MVAGASGFIAMHCVLQLVEQGYRVRGTLRVLKAAQVSGVRRDVMTSSVAAIWQGHTNYDKTFDESDWSNLEGEIDK